MIGQSPKPIPVTVKTMGGESLTSEEIRSMQQFQCEKILDFKIQQSRRCYFIKWKGYENRFNTWQFITNIAVIAYELAQFQRINKRYIQEIESQWMKTQVQNEKVKIKRKPHFVIELLHLQQFASRYLKLEADELQDQLAQFQEKIEMKKRSYQRNGRKNKAKIKSHQETSTLNTKSDQTSMLNTKTHKETSILGIIEIKETKLAKAEQIKQKIELKKQKPQAQGGSSLQFSFGEQYQKKMNNQNETSQEIQESSDRTQTIKDNESIKYTESIKDILSNQEQSISQKQCKKMNQLYTSFKSQKIGIEQKKSPNQEEDMLQTQKNDLKVKTQQIWPGKGENIVNNYQFNSVQHSNGFISQKSMENFMKFRLLLLRINNNAENVQEELEFFVKFEQKNIFVTQDNQWNQIAVANDDRRQNIATLLKCNLTKLELMHKRPIVKELVRFYVFQGQVIIELITQQNGYAERRFISYELLQLFYPSQISRLLCLTCVG